jgi:multidrug efflux system membrane fusion protein
VPVVAARVRKTDVPYTVEANGVVIPLKSANVGSQVEGVIKRVAFTEGADVRAGQVLFEIDRRPYEAAYNQAVANVARDKANHENAARESERYATLAAKDYVTKEQADQQRANAAATAANVAASEAALATARFNLENATIRAPIGGRTGSILVKEGNLVHANGATPLVVINQVSPILVRFAIPSTQLPLLQKYGTSGTLAVQATPNSGTNVMADTSSGPLGLSIGGGDPAQGSSAQSGPPGGAGTGGNGGNTAGRTPTASSQLTTLVQPEHGTLSFIDNTVDTTTGTVLLKGTFPNPEKRLWSGEFVTTQLSLFMETGALVIPSQAVVNGQQGTYVYVITDSSTAMQRPVVVERTSGNMSVIASGLREGQQIVTEGQSRLTPNAKVTISTGQGGGRGGRGGGKGGRGGRGGDSTAAPGATAPPAGGAPNASAAPGADKATAPAAGADSINGGRKGGRGGRGGRRGGGTQP